MNTMYLKLIACFALGGVFAFDGNNKPNGLADVSYQKEFYSEGEPDSLVQSTEQLPQKNNSLECTDAVLVTTSPSGNHVDLSTAELMVDMFDLWQDLLPESISIDTANYNIVTYKSKPLNSKIMDSVIELARLYNEAHNARVDSTGHGVKRALNDYTNLPYSNYKVIESYYIPYKDIIEMHEKFNLQENNGFRAYIGFDSIHDFDPNSVSLHIMLAPAKSDSVDFLTSEGVDCLYDLTAPCPCTCPSKENSLFGKTPIDCHKSK